MKNPKHLRLVNAYIKHGSRQQALLDVGYSESYAATHGLKIFDRADVRTEIEKRQERMRERSKVTEDWIIERLIDIADANVGDLIELDDKGKPFVNYSRISPALRRAIMVVDVDEEMSGRGENASPVKKIKIRTSDKLKALDMLAKVLGIYAAEKMEVSGDADLVKRINEGRFRVEEGTNK